MLDYVLQIKITKESHPEVDDRGRAADMLLFKLPSVDTRGGKHQLDF